MPDFKIILDVVYISERICLYQYLYAIISF